MPLADSDIISLIPDDEDADGMVESREPELLQTNDNSEKENNIPENETDEDDDCDDPENEGELLTPPVWLGTFWLQSIVTL